MGHEKEGVSFVEHYIDDFITLGMSSSNECEMNQHLMLGTCETMGVSIEPEVRRTQFIHSISRHRAGLDGDGNETTCEKVRKSGGSNSVVREESREET